MPISNQRIAIGHISFGTVDGTQIQVSGGIHLKNALPEDGDQKDIKAISSLNISGTLTFKAKPYPVSPVRLRQEDGTIQLMIVPTQWLEWMLLFGIWQVWNELG